MTKVWQSGTLQPWKNLKPVTLKFTWKNLWHYTPLVTSLTSTWSPLNSDEPLVDISLTISFWKFDSVWLWSISILNFTIMNKIKWWSWCKSHFNSWCYHDTGICTSKKYHFLVVFCTVLSTSTCKQCGSEMVILITQTSLIICTKCQWPRYQWFRHKVRPTAKQLWDSWIA